MRINVSMKKEDRDLLHALADDKGMSASAYIRWLVRREARQQELEKMRYEHIRAAVESAEAMPEPLNIPEDAMEEFKRTFDLTIRSMSLEAM